ncbi:substrate-binding domain-containing protein [Marilutibacter alkalisoli]|uniref:LysR family transcriptional regulator n=1 Tax=Marilutibacter alkalisoli TaxID=2591633 RepID=A0A514BN14_9GAMM|nr:substrate-binding domain-containing protein [Lysobacter alkalisoli]QDH68760.1 LysR family transcriptional regulator [Lysobacter alkalisoli]
MFKIGIEPYWKLEVADRGQMPARLIGLLLAVHETGSLAAGCRRAGLSYRYAWGLLKQAQALFGRPLLRMTRGRGARLTPIGERLVWADKRIAARLSPMFESLATELEAELERYLSAQAMPLRIHASHGFGVETLRRFMSDDNMPLDLKYRSPDDALAALRSGSCDLAGLHLPIGALEEEIARHYLDRFDLQGDRVLHLAMRRQGLVLAPGNPKGVHGLDDLLRGDLRFIHRQPGSGTRLLLECMLARQGLSFAAINACDVEELTHAAVAAYVASGLADAGLALEPPARRYGLDFVPMVTEHYFFLCREEMLESGQLAELVDLLRGDAFRHALGQLPGYDPSYCGTVQTLPEAFPSIRAAQAPQAAA